MMNKLTNKILFVGGKGGVGKSTSAAALAWKLSQAGEKTLLISTDPAHNLGHIFNQPIGGKIMNVEGLLFALEIDPERETTSYMNGEIGRASCREIQTNAGGAVGYTTYR